MTKSFQKFLSLLLVLSLNFSISTPLLFAKRDLSENLATSEENGNQTPKWLKLSEKSEQLTQAQRDRIIEKIKKARNYEPSSESRQKIKRLQERKKEIRKKIKQSAISSEERQQVRELLHQQRTELKEINAQLKSDLKSGIRQELTNAESALVEDVEPNVLMELQSMIDDPLYEQQWGLKALNLDGGNWNLESANTSENIIVAVVDTGVDFGHEDLEGTQWISDACVDADGNEIPGGCVKGGWDFIDHDDDPFPSDNYAHGTSIAGIIGANTGNETGIASAFGTVNQEADNNIQIMSLRACCTTEGFFPSQAASEAIRFAVNNGAKIINASFGGPTYSAELEEAIRYARDNGVFIIAAAGNYSQDNDIEPLYPANYDLENIVSVASINQNDGLAWFSNFGANTVDIAAPGESVLSLMLNNAYGQLNGTSFSTPFVVSVLARFISSGQDITDLLNDVVSLSSLSGKIQEGRALRFPKPETPEEPVEENNPEPEYPVIDEPVNPVEEISETDEPTENPIEENTSNTGADTLKTIIISDDDADYAGNWQLKQKKGYEESSFHIAKTKHQQPIASWDFENNPDIKDTKVRISVSWVAHSNRTDSAQYSVQDENGESVILVNQQKTVDEMEETDLQHLSNGRQKEIIKRIQERFKKIRGKIKDNRGEPEWSGWYELGTFEGVSGITLGNEQSGISNEQSDEDAEMEDEIKNLEKEALQCKKDLKNERNRSKKRALKSNIRRLRDKVKELKEKLKHIKKKQPSREVFLTADDIQIEVLEDTGGGEDPDPDPEPNPVPDPIPGEERVPEDIIITTGEWISEVNEDAPGGTTLIYTGTEAGMTAEFNFADLLSSASTQAMSIQVLENFDGEFTLSVSWTTGNDRADAVPYSLVHTDGTYDFTINQRLFADQSTVGAKNQWSGWYEVGTFTFDENSTLILTTVDNSDGLHKIVVDEFRLVKKEELPSDPVCGNGETEIGEMCDDGNTLDGDGCSAICTIENTGGNVPQIPIGDGSLILHHSDHLSGANVDTDESGTIIQLLDYYPFGETRLDEHSTEYQNDYKFTGKEKDDETGLHYYEARYYDSSIGRFVSRDTWEGELGDPQSLNRYAYVKNNPLKYTDPTGKSATLAILGIGAAEAIYAAAVAATATILVYDTMNRAGDLQTGWNTKSSVDLQPKKKEDLHTGGAGLAGINLNGNIVESYPSDSGLEHKITGVEGVLRDKKENIIDTPANTGIERKPYMEGRYERGAKSGRKTEFEKRNRNIDGKFRNNQKRENNFKQKPKSKAEIKARRSKNKSKKK